MFGCCSCACLARSGRDLYPAQPNTSIFYVILSVEWSVYLDGMCCQTEDDEDIISSDMIILMTCKQKMNQSYIMIIIVRFNELMLRHDVCSLSFSEIHSWIKKSVDTHGRHVEPKKLIGDQVQVLLTSFTRPPRPSGPKMERDQVQHILYAGFGLHDWANLKRTPRPHTDSIWDVLYMVRKGIS